MDSIPNQIYKYLNQPTRIARDEELWINFIDKLNPLARKHALTIQLDQHPSILDHITDRRLHQPRRPNASKVKQSF